MEITFLGGASGIGASCVLVEDGALRLVVDCGIRQSRGETLPDLATLQSRLGGTSPTALVLTHAHLDHTGALPVFCGAFPGVPVITTRPTADLVRILLRDALKIMDTDRDGEIPLYGAPQVDAALAAIRAVDFDDPVDLGPATVRMLPAGHILGAAMAAVQTRTRCALISGDISVGDQRTIPGLSAPRLRPDVFVVESTYGDRLHASREVEERRLCAQVAQAIADGGHVLIPAFAVGRGQEVLLSLKDAMRRGEIPRFPVYADGMVRAVCAAYRAHPAYLRTALRRRVGRGKDPFFGKNFAPIASRTQRAEVIRGPPCCVVASSGMLSGGASPLYAREWAGEERSLIAITGYQDEEAPGRALLALADGESRTLRLPSGSVQVRCRVSRYHLSAHADADEVTGLVRRLTPSNVCVVHGDPRSREALAARLAPIVRGEVAGPMNGDTVRVRGGRRRQQTTWMGPGIAAGRALDDAGLRAVAALLARSADPARARFTADQIAQAWFGEGAGDAALQQTRAALAQDRSAFEPDPRLAFRYRLVRAASSNGAPAPLARVLARLDDLLTPESGVYKRSAHQESRRLVLSFHFPQIQGPRLRARLDALEQSTGWTVAVNPRPHQGRLAEVVREVLPEGTRISGAPSIVFEREIVQAKVAPLPDAPGLHTRRYREVTGWRLSLSAAEAVPAACVLPDGCLDPQASRRVFLEVFAEVPEASRPLKARYPGVELVLHFIHPGLGARHAERMQALSERTGRPVRVHPHPNHQALVERARALIPVSWSLVGPPGYVPQRDVLRIRTWDLPPDDERRRVLSEIRAQTGCTAEVEVDG